MLRTNRPRSGLTLTEVLIAMFVMAIGMIAIFTLFPLGAIKVGQALKDDRTSQTAMQADAYVRAYWRHEVVARLQATPPQTVNEPFFTAMGNDTPSLPVLIDPLGYQARTSPDQSTVAATASAGASSLQRSQFVAVTSASAAFRIGAMSDDVLFAPNGAPPPLAESPLTRQGRYTWAALIQRTQATPPGTAQLTILAFDGRSRLPARTAPAGSPTPVPQAYNDELMITTSVTPGSRQLDVTVPTRGADDPVLLREGGWVLVYDPNPATRTATFHRIVGMTQGSATPTTTSFTLDLETPLRGVVPPLPAAATPINGAQLYFFAGLSEVFERAPLGPDPNS